MYDLGADFHAHIPLDKRTSKFLKVTSVCCVAALKKPMFPEGGIAKQIENEKAKRQAHAAANEEH